MPPRELQLREEGVLHAALRRRNKGLHRARPVNNKLTDQDVGGYVRRAPGVGRAFDAVEAGKGDLVRFRHFIDFVWLTLVPRHLSNFNFLRRKIEGKSQVIRESK